MRLFFSQTTKIGKNFPLSLLPPSLERGRGGRMKMRGNNCRIFAAGKKGKNKKSNPLGSWRGGGICMLLLFSGATYFSIFALPNPSFPVRMYARAGRHMVFGGGGGGRLFSLFSWEKHFREYECFPPKLQFSGWAPKGEKGGGRGGNNKQFLLSFLFGKFCSIAKLAFTQGQTAD